MLVLFNNPIIFVGIVHYLYLQIFVCVTDFCLLVGSSPMVFKLFSHCVHVDFLLDILVGAIKAFLEVKPYFVGVSFGLPSCDLNLYSLVWRLVDSACWIFCSIENSMSVLLDFSAQSSI